MEAKGKRWNRVYLKLLMWRAKYFSNRNFILLLAFLAGIGGGLAAVLMKVGTHYIKHFLIMGIPARYHNYLFFIYPLIGILLTVGYRLLFRYSSFGYGMTELLLVISKRSSIMPTEKMHTPIVSASLTVGFGGSVGLEAPIVTSGAAVGANLARLFHLGYKKRTLLLSCGVAAGIGAVFNAPIAGLIFCIEVLMLELSVPAFVPLLIASVTGTIISRQILGSEILFNTAQMEPFYNREIPFYLILGVFTGLVSYYFLDNFTKAYDSLQEVHDTFKRAIYGGIMLGLMIFIFPPLYGEGYSSIKEILHGDAFKLLSESFFFHRLTTDWFLLIFLGGMIVVKVFASAATVGAGGNGGTFAPSLFLGGICGFFLARLINTLHFYPYQVSEINFTLVGMAGILSGVLHAPLTAIFLIAEITGGYNLVLPLMLVSAISFATSSWFRPHSVYLQQLAKKGHVHFHDKDKTILHSLKLKKLIENDFITIPPEGTLRNLIEGVSRSKRNVFPVVNKDEVLEGVVYLDDFRQYMFKPESYDSLSVETLKKRPESYIQISDTMEEAMQKFDTTGTWNLPVTDQNGHYVGMMSKSKIFSEYRKTLKQQAREDTEIIE